MNRGSAYGNQGNYKEAAQEYSKAIKLREALRNIFEQQGEWPPQMTNDLAKAYWGRGSALNDQCRYEDAVIEFANAIELMESLRKILEPRSEWPPQMTNDLANAYMNRGSAYGNQGNYKEAAQEYSKAIELGEALRNILEQQGEWPPQMTNSLAAAYMNR
ncbi:MAG: tetratricopeptide repeat protein, partial [Desulfobacteraceae bacterium]|nr:tetratricopeptide repeat protein [Desulfobacteraceae bacterium]